LDDLQPHESSSAGGSRVAIPGEAGFSAARIIQTAFYPRRRLLRTVA
jgi:hypothetical protein